MKKNNPIWSLNESFFGESFEKSKTPELQWGLALNTPINKMPVKIATGENNVYGFSGYGY